VLRKFVTKTAVISLNSINWRRRNVFLIKHELHFYILFRRNSVLKRLINESNSIILRQYMASLYEEHSDLYMLQISPSLRIAESSRLYWDRRASPEGRREMDGRIFVSI
jgi:uncharacterized membrane protein YhfC